MAKKKNPWWKKNIKKSLKEIGNAGDTIELAKIRFERDHNFPLGIFGIGATVLISVSSSGVLKGLGTNTQIGTWIIITYIFSAVMLLLGLGIIAYQSKIQGEILSWLYRQKNKKK